MLAVEIIARKRDGCELSDRSIDTLIRGYADDCIPDYQMAAFAMAVFLNGMTPRETTALTRAMLDSGDRLRWPDDGIRRVDKHSTGGIGDKISLPLAPLLATCGVQVPMLSGRGLGPTGGTLDKLESIPGFRTDLSLAEIQTLVPQIGCVITGASAELVPADRRLYALRDVTATVPSIPLITASIMSKKLVEMLDDVAAEFDCMDVTLNGLGVFPHRKKPTVVWTGILCPQPIVALQQRLQRRLQEAGWTPDTREFHPHVTVARVNSRRRRVPDVLFELLDRHTATDFGSSRLESIVLYQSELTPRGGRYTATHRSKLRERDSAEQSPQ